jgi:hypothetical protein
MNGANQTIKLSRFTYQATKIDCASWLSDGIEPQQSSIHGIGLVSTKDHCQGDKIIVLGGVIFSVDEVKAGKALHQSTTGYKEGYYLGRPLHEINQAPLPDDYLNHSCDPNLWLEGTLTLVARRSISAGEELTVDYATWEIDEGWQLSGQCNCGAKMCRRRVSGRDWRIPEFQQRYKRHVLPCLIKRILFDRRSRNSRQGSHVRLIPQADRQSNRELPDSLTETVTFSRADSGPMLRGSDLPHEAMESGL